MSVNEISQGMIDSICLSMRHDFWLGGNEEKDCARRQCVEWIQAIEKHGWKRPEPSNPEEWVPPAILQGTDAADDLDQPATLEWVSKRDGWDSGIGFACYRDTSLEFANGWWQIFDSCHKTRTVTRRQVIAAEELAKAMGWVLIDRIEENR